MPRPRTRAGTARAGGTAARSEPLAASGSRPSHRHLEATDPALQGGDDLGPRTGDQEQPEGYKHPAADPQHPELMPRSEEHTSELQSRVDLVCRLLLEK